MNIATKNIYCFGNGIGNEIGASRDVLGGKGFGLAEMSGMSLPVPPGFTIATDACRFYLEHGRLPDGLDEEIADALSWLGSTVGRRFNDPANPLLVSVRSPVTMRAPP